MYGAILGDIIGSPYEFGCGKKSKDFDLLTEESGFTDDTVMTVAVGEALLELGAEPDSESVKQAVTKHMRDWGRRYPRAGYGSRFSGWLRAKDPKPYYSCGNGSAMRVSPVGWLYKTLTRTQTVAKATAEATHNHPEGIKGAVATATAIYGARNGWSKQEIKDYIEDNYGYDLTTPLADIRPGYHHVETCQGSVPQSIRCFLEGKDYEDSVRNAVSLAGDTDTMGAVAGSIAEAFYGIPLELMADCKSRIPNSMQRVEERLYTRYVEMLHSD